MVVETVLSGLLFWFIIITNIASGRFGYETFSDLNSEAQLQKINNYPKKFKISFVLILAEHIGIVALALMLFFAFNSYSLLLAAVWTIFRVTEGLIQIQNKKSYWGLLNMAKRYSVTSDTEKKALIYLGRVILRTKNSVFKFAQIFFSIGTLAYSILFVTYGVVPEIIGWFGIIASIIYCLGNIVTLGKPNFKTLWSIGGLLILLFEIILGSWLILSPFI